MVTSRWRAAGLLRRACVVTACLVAACLVGAACSSSGGGSKATTPVTICTPKDGTQQAAGDLPDVKKIPEAIAALEAKLGGPQQYFEVNATARVVNMFVALNNGTIAQGQKASGGTFAATDLGYQPDKVLGQIHQKVPDAILESFYVNGDSKGNVQYGVLASAQCGGGLDILVGPDGSVKAVDPVQ
jgi:hypothetical protein